MNSVDSTKGLFQLYSWKKPEGGLSTLTKTLEATQLFKGSSTAFFNSPDSHNPRLKLQNLPELGAPGFWKTLKDIPGLSRLPDPVEPKVLNFCLNTWMVPLMYPDSGAQSLLCFIWLTLWKVYFSVDWGGNKRGADQDLFLWVNPEPPSMPCLCFV